jgi:hypothetical protein
VRVVDVVLPFPTHVGIRRALAAVVLVALAVPMEARAQCGANRSTCSACHDGARAALPASDAWHDDHAFADLCVTCHGGRGDIVDADEAHLGLVDPLSSSNETCASCHGAKTALLVERYRVRRDAAVDVHPKSAPGPVSGSDRTPARRSNVHGEAKSNLVLMALIGMIGAFGVLFIVRNELGRPETRGAPPSP